MRSLVVCRVKNCLRWSLIPSTNYEMEKNVNAVHIRTQCVCMHKIHIHSTKVQIRQQQSRAMGMATYALYFVTQNMYYNIHQIFQIKNDDLTSYTVPYFQLALQQIVYATVENCFKVISQFQLLFPSIIFFPLITTFQLAYFAFLQDLHAF